MPGLGLGLGLGLPLGCVWVRGSSDTLTLALALTLALTLTLTTTGRVAGDSHALECGELVGRQAVLDHRVPLPMQLLLVQRREQLRRSLAAVPVGPGRARPPVRTVKCRQGLGRTADEMVDGFHFAERLGLGLGLGLTLRLGLGLALALIF